MSIDYYMEQAIWHGRSPRHVPPGGSLPLSRQISIQDRRMLLSVPRVDGG